MARKAKTPKEKKPEEPASPSHHSEDEDQLNEDYKHEGVIKRFELGKFTKYFAAANEYYMRQPKFGNLKRLPVDILDKAKMKLVTLPLM